MGFVDRGGGREAKGSSLRRSKKNPGAPTTKNRPINKNYVAPATRTAPDPPPACLSLLQRLAEYLSRMPSTEEAVEDWVRFCTEGALLGGDDDKTEGDARWKGRHVDTAVALLSRRLESDRDAVFRRAVEEGRLGALLCWCGEMERQELLLETCRDHNKLAAQRRREVVEADRGTAGKHVSFAPSAISGSVRAVGDPEGCLLYCLVGVPVSAVDRLNRKVHEQWIADVRRNAMGPEVVGILSGLNFSREKGTHFAQEWLLRESWGIACDLRLPLVLHLYADDDAMAATVDRAAEVLVDLLQQTEGPSAGTEGPPNLPRAVVLYNGLKAMQCSKAIRDLVQQRPPLTVGRHAVDAAQALVPFLIIATAEGLSPTPATGGGEGGAKDTPAIRFGDLLPRLEPHKRVDAAMQLSQLLIGTGSPWGTPQSIEDAHLRTLPNEPANYPYVVAALHKCMAGGREEGSRAQGRVLSADELAEVALVNCVRVFFAESMEGLEAVGETGEHAADVPEVEVATGSGGAPLFAPPDVAHVGLQSGTATVEDDLSDLLVQAARERAQLEQERLAEEIRCAQRESDRKRRVKVPKKNVKANNRSNFTHFRNKDFAPKGTAHGGGPDTSAAGSAAHPTGPAGEGKESDDEDKMDPFLMCRQQQLDALGSDSESYSAAGTGAPRSTRRKNKRRQQQQRREQHGSGDSEQGDGGDDAL